MRGPRIRLRAAVVAAIGAAGVCAGHVLDYVVVAGPHRDAFLHRTGHGYFGGATLIAAAAAGFAVALTAILGYRAGRAGRGRPIRVTAARLALIQVLAFAGLEILERVAAGASLSDLGLLLAIGVPIQGLGAVVIALLLAVVRRAAEAAGRRASPRRALRTGSRPVRVPEDPLLPRGRRVRPITLRGPPVAV